MMEEIVRITAVIGALLAAVAGGRLFLTGAILIRDTDEPGFRLRRRNNPFVFWSFVVFFYVIVLGAAGAAIFLPMASS